MRKRLIVHLAMAVAVALGLACHYTNYPVITDTFGPWDEAVLDGQYDQAYVVPSFQFATIHTDGSDELFTLVSQDWKGDQWLYTYNNFDPTADVIFLDQLYCDPNHAEDCWVAKSWNPDLQEWDPWDYPFTDPPHDPYDNIRDYVGDPDCSGYRSLFYLWDDVRFGECGSGIMSDPQGAAHEFALLEETTFRGRTVYSVPFDSQSARVIVTAADGHAEQMPIYGSFEAYLDQDLRMVLPVTPNLEYQQRWIERFADEHGAALRVNLLYGSLDADFKLKVARR
jgi:hypothetical protein